MLGRLALIAAFLLALVGPRPSTGVPEVRDLAVKRVEQWKAFASRLRTAYEAASRRMRDAAKAGRRELAKRG